MSSDGFDLDMFQTEIGGISKYQVVVIVLTLFLSLIQGFTSQSSIFIHSLPKYRCADPLLENATRSCNTSEDALNNLYNTYESDYSCSRRIYNISDCSGFDCNITSCIGSQQSVDRIKCDHGYVFDKRVFGKTAATQFELVCDRRYLDTIAQTLFFFGFFLGSLVVGPVSDWFGRKTATAVFAAGLLGSNCAAAFSPTFEVFTVLRILVGTFNVANFIAAYTYCIEISDTKFRTVVGVLSNGMGSIANLTVPWIANWLKDWRYLELSFGLVHIPFLIVFLFLPETPRWLLANGKTNKAKAIVKKYAESKGKELTEDTWESIVNTEKRKKSRKNKKSYISNKKVRLWDLFRRPRMRMFCLISIYTWFSVCMMYYGLSLNGGNLAGNPYVNTFLNGFVEIFGNAAVCLTVYSGRKLGLALSLTLSAFFCFASMICQLYADDNSDLLTLNTVFAIIGKCFATTCFTTLYIVTSELFPTLARTTAISMGSMSARVGLLFAPLIVEIQRSVPWFAPAVFGSLSIVAAFLTSLYPETSKMDLITTLDETEDYYKNNMPMNKCCFVRRIRVADDKKYLEAENVFVEQKNC